MIKKRVILAFCLFLNVPIVNASCSVFFENSGTTCPIVHSVTVAGVTSFVSTFKSLRASQIEAPTKELAKLMEKYDYLTSYYYSIANVINAMELGITMTQKEITFYNEKEFSVKKIRSDLSILQSNLDLLEQEIAISGIK